MGRRDVDGAIAVIAALAEVSDDAALSDAYREAMRNAYWDEHDIHAVMAIAYGGISRLLAVAADPGTSEEHEYDMRSAAKGLTYDLASFAWPGWDEPDIEIDPSIEAAGRAAAFTNLSMAQALDKGDLALSRAHWMLGAHLLTSGDLEGAGASFDAAAACARNADQEADALLAEAFSVLSEAAGGRASEPDYEAALNRLRLADGGEGFVAQVETARSVIGR